VQDSRSPWRRRSWSWSWWSWLPPWRGEPVTDDVITFALIGAVGGLYPLIGGLYYLHYRIQAKVACLVAIHLTHHPEDKGTIDEACGD